MQYASETYASGEKTDYAEDFKVLDSKVKKLMDDYRNTVKMTKQYLQPNPGVRIEDAVYDKFDLSLKNKAAKQPITALGNIFIQTGDGIGDTSLLGSALIATGEAQNDIGEFWTEFEDQVNSKWIKVLQKYIDVDLKDAADMRKKLEKARLDLDAQKAKVKKNVRTLNYTPNVDHKVEKETEKLKKAEAKFQRLYFSCDNRFKQITSESQDGILVDLMEYIQLQMSYFQKSLERLVGVLTNVTEQRRLVRRDRLAKNLAGIEAFALSDFRPSNADEVGLKAGDSVIVTNQDTGEDGYWEVNNGGVTGLCPSSFLGFYKGIANQDFYPQSEGDLGLKRGDEVIILNRDTGEPGIFQGFKDGAVGFFPSACVSLGNRPVSFAEPSQAVPSNSLLDPNNQLNASANQRNSIGGISRSPSVNSFVVEQTNSHILEALEQLSTAMMACSVGRLSSKAASYSEQLKDDLLSATQNLTDSARQLVTGAKGHMDEARLSTIAAQSSVDLNEVKDSVMRLASAIEDPQLQNMLLMGAGGIGTTLATLVSVSQCGEAELVAEKGKLMVQSIGKFMDVVENVSVAKPKGFEQLPGPSKPEDGVNKAGQSLEASSLDMERAIQNMNLIRNELNAKNPSEAIDADMVGEMADVTVIAKELIKAAILRKNDVQNIKSTSEFYNANTIWNDGFVSCAKSIADSVVSLVDTFSHYINDPSGGSTLNRIVAETNVALSMCRELDFSSRVKGADAPTHKSLVSASSKIQGSLRNIMDSARLAGLSSRTTDADDQQGFQGDKEGVRYKAAEIEHQERILAAEAALRAEQEKLQRLRKDVYK